MFFSAVWAFLIPPVTNSIYFNNAKSETKKTDHCVDQSTPSTTNDSSSIPQESKTSKTIESQLSKNKVGTTLIFNIHNLITYYNIILQLNNK